MPICSIYFGGLAALFGGNFDVGLAVLFASYTDVMTDATQRTTLFFITTAMQYVGQAVFPPIGGLLLDLDGKGGTPLAAMIVGIGAGVVSLGLTGLLFPETKGAQTTKEDEDHDQISDRIAAQERDAADQENFEAQAVASAFTAKVRKGVEGIGIINAIALGLALFFVSVGIKAIDWFGLLQYPVIRLGWTYTQASAR